MSLRICEFYLRGECLYGDLCWNSHAARTHRDQYLIDAARIEAVQRTSSKPLLYCIFNLFYINT